VHTEAGSAVIHPALLREEISGADALAATALSQAICGRSDKSRDKAAGCFGLASRGAIVTLAHIRESNIAEA
jgi:hypothetical protein